MQSVQNRSLTRNSNPPRGGQASIGLFGIAGSDRTHHAAKSNRNGVMKTDDRPRLVHGLTFTQRRSVIRSRVDMASVSLASYERSLPFTGPSMESLMAAARARAARQSEEEEATPKATPAMLAVAYASDMREAFPHHHDDEAAEYARRCAGAGYVEATLAMEGN